MKSYENNCGQRFETKNVRNKNVDTLQANIDCNRYHYLQVMPQQHPIIFLPKQIFVEKNGSNTVLPARY